MPGSFQGIGRSFKVLVRPINVNRRSITALPASTAASYSGDQGPGFLARSHPGSAFAGMGSNANAGLALGLHRGDFLRRVRAARFATCLGETRWRVW